ncbi:MAG: hypothetical protein DRI90_11930 [Deltaproteobacteria bacterium]|nr:MAG: hypothetical protein DRI90_11930 [Deltaproteobacteria bacterium]
MKPSEYCEMKRRSRPIRIRSSQNYAVYRLPEELDAKTLAELPESEPVPAARIAEIMSWGLVPPVVRFPPLAY